MEWNWKRTNDPKLFGELLILIEPNMVERTAIINCILETNIYNVYIAENSVSFRIDAICIATFLNKTQTLHIEDFALHPNIRGKGYAKILWNSWWDFVVNTEKWINIDQSMTIEVYTKNVFPWNKIMGVNPLFNSDSLLTNEDTIGKNQSFNVELSPLFWTNEKIVWMGKNLINNPRDIESEWTQIQFKERIRQQKKYRAILAKL
jgi:GNAT superfamily N-acetyltransferase